MRPAPTLMMIWLLATSLGCPVLQMFDRWDHELQTGHDTEFIFMLLALCVAAAFLLAREIVCIGKVLPARTIGTVCSFIRALVESLIHESTATFIFASPPLSALRV